MSDSQPNKRKGITFGRVVSPVGTVQVMDAPFPVHRTLRWIPQGATPESLKEAENGAANVTFVVTQEVLLATNRHVSQTLDKEMGGFLLGNRYQCPNTGRNYVIIDQYLKADYTEGTEVSLNFTNESWAQLNDQLSGKFMGKLLVGWYHSHPKMNVFLSAHDVTIHESRFAEPWKTALVIEPAKHFGGFFAWKDGKLDAHNTVEFYELLEGESRESVVAWVNYVGVDPKTNARPVLRGLNTMTALTASTITLPGDGLRQARGLVPPPQQKVLGVTLPRWLSGARLWIGLGVLAILAFVVTFALTNWLSGSNKGDQAAEAGTGTEATDPAAASNALEKLDVAIGDKPQVDVEKSTLTVYLAVTGVPDAAVKDVQESAQVTIDGREAEIRKVIDRPGGFNLIAAAELGDKIEALRTGNKSREVEIKSAFAYGGLGTQSNITIELRPFKLSTGKNIVDLTYKQTKKTETRPRANQGGTKPIDKNLPITPAQPPKNQTFDEIKNEEAPPVPVKKTPAANREEERRRKAEEEANKNSQNGRRVQGKRGERPRN